MKNPRGKRPSQHAERASLLWPMAMTMAVSCVMSGTPWYKWYLALPTYLCAFLPWCKCCHTASHRANWRILIVWRPLKARAMIEREVPTHGLMVEYLTYYVRLGALRRKRHKGMRDGGATTVQR